MAKRAITIVFPDELMKEPIMYLVCRDNDLILNIRRARITAEIGEATIELEGEESNIEKAIQEFTAKGLTVEPVVGDIITG